MSNETLNNKQQEKNINKRYLWNKISNKIFERLSSKRRAKSFIHK